MASAAPVRRLRNARPETRVGRLVLGQADYELFTAIDRHGPLPSSYLYEFTKHLRRDRSHLQNRLTEFYHGDAGGPYLTRPSQQFAAYEARYQHLVYDLTRRARLLLAECDVMAPRPARSDPFVHRLMTACASASFELSAAHHGLRYISTDDIRSRQAERVGNRIEGAAPLLQQALVVPDFLFGLEYPGEGFRFFAVECDRNTESIERRNLNQTAFARKLAAYSALLDAQAYRGRWGTPNLHVLIITTSARHARNLLAAIKAHVAARYQSAFAISIASSFGADWRVPKEPLGALLGDPWLTVSGARSFGRT